MQAVSGDAIVNTAPIAGVIADPGMAPYVAAKHAGIGLTKAVAIDCAKAGIRVNALAPDLVETPMTRHWLDDRRHAGHRIERAADGKSRGTRGDRRHSTLFVFYHGNPRNRTNVHYRWRPDRALSDPMQMPSSLSANRSRCKGQMSRYLLSAH